MQLERHGWDIHAIKGARRESNTSHATASGPLWHQMTQAEALRRAARPALEQHERGIHAALACENNTNAASTVRGVGKAAAEGNAEGSG